MTRVIDASRVVIISAQRCGGLFLAGCLSNHPDIHCPREEPFQGQSIWQQKLNLAPAVLLDFVLSEPYYKVAMCRLTYDQAFHTDIHRYLVDHQVAILHLVRAVMPTVTSTLLAKQEMQRGVPRHSFDDDFRDDEVLDVGPDVVLHRIRHLLTQRKRFGELYAGNPQIEVRYEAMTRPGSGRLAQAVEWDVCRFLGIGGWRLEAHNRKMHQRRLASYYRRWEEIERAINDRDWGINVWTS